MAINQFNARIGHAARILLGLVYFVFGLNFFLHFIPTPPPDPESGAGKFLGALFASGYFFVVLKIIESIFGLLLILNIFAPILLILIFPVTLNILLFHIFLEPLPSALGISFLLLVLNTYLIWVNRVLYSPLFKVRSKQVEEPAA
jgi:hypothetical protein